MKELITLNPKGQVRNKEKEKKPTMCLASCVRQEKGKNLLCATSTMWLTL